MVRVGATYAADQAISVPLSLLNARRAAIEPVY